MTDSLFDSRKKYRYIRICANQTTNLSFFIFHFSFFMAKSLKFRLTRAYAVGFIASLLVCFTAIYCVQRYNLLRAINKKLDYFLIERVDPQGFCTELLASALRPYSFSNSSASLTQPMNNDLYHRTRGTTQISLLELGRKSPR